MCSAFSLEVIMAEKKTTTKKKPAEPKKPQVTIGGEVWDVVRAATSGSLIVKRGNVKAIASIKDVKLNAEAKKLING